MSNFDSMTNINYLVFIWNVFVDTLLLLIAYAWKMYDMQTLHAGGIPMFRGTYLVIYYHDCVMIRSLVSFMNKIIKSQSHSHIILIYSRCPIRIISYYMYLFVCVSLFLSKSKYILLSLAGKNNTTKAVSKGISYWYDHRYKGINNSHSQSFIRSCSKTTHFLW